jgi:hypothetical protein
VPVVGLSDNRGFIQWYGVPRRPLVICDGCEKMVRVRLVVEQHDRPTFNYCENCGATFVRNRWPHMNMANTVDKKGEPVGILTSPRLSGREEHPKFML